MKYLLPVYDHEQVRIIPKRADFMSESAPPCYDLLFRFGAESAITIRE